MPLQSTSGAATYDAFGGGAAAVPNYIEDVFSTYLYTGVGSAITITNGIDLAGDGGLVWLKNRGTVSNNSLHDTTRTPSYQLVSNSTAAQDTVNGDLSSFNSNGFSLGTSGGGNNITGNIASWTFRKQPKFFDVVTYTGDGGFKYVNHNLGSVPGCIIVKRTDSTGNWAVYHRSLGAGYTLYLNTTGASAGENDFQSVSSTQFAVYDDAGSWTNKSGGTYVAYLFAHDAGGFGLEGLDNVISCGSFTTDGSTNATINLGWEPQWILTKDTGAADDWRVSDNMRGLGGIGSGSVTARLVPNTSGAENSATGDVKVFATGANISLNASRTYIYIAIRRGPMEVPTSGTSVYKPIARTSTGSATKVTGVGFTPDASLIKRRDNTANNVFVDRLRGRNLLRADNTGAEIAASSAGRDLDSFDMDGISIGTNWNVDLNAGGGATYIDHFFKRAPGFFDEVCYTGTGSATTQAHNLGVIPELMIVKKRSSATNSNWITSFYISASNAADGFLNLTASLPTTAWSSTNFGAAPTASVFSIGAFSSVNENAGTFVAYLFATLAGVSKVGSYTGNGSSQTINCGFTGGARFVMIKRTDSTGDWYVWDSSRGIVAGNDPHLSLNTTAAEVTTDDSVDTDSTGFVVNQVAATNVNVTSATYIFLAIA